MPREFARMDRVSIQIQREIATMLQKQYPMSEFGMLSVQEVKVSRDLQHAKVYITIFNAKLSNDEVIAALNDGAGSMRSELGKQISMKYTPELFFIYDDSVEFADKVANLLQ